jgi:hypothetical protein
VYLLLKELVIFVVNHFGRKQYCYTFSLSQRHGSFVTGYAFCSSSWLFFIVNQSTAKKIVLYSINFVTFTFLKLLRHVCCNSIFVLYAGVAAFCIEWIGLGPQVHFDKKQGAKI